MFIVCIPNIVTQNMHNIPKGSPDTRDIVSITLSCHLPAGVGLEVHASRLAHTYQSYLLVERIGSGKRTIHFSFVFWDAGPLLDIVFEYGEKLRADGVHFSLKETRKPISHGNTHPVGQMNGSLFNLIVPSLGNLDSRFPGCVFKKNSHRNFVCHLSTNTARDAKEPFYPPVSNLLQRLGIP